MNKPVKVLNTTPRSRATKPRKAIDLPPSSAPTISASVDRDATEPTTWKTMAKKARRTKGSANL